MVRALPPLNALRAFEAAARHMQFARAADELGVTPAAVSHQIRALEEYLGVRLFARGSQKISLTEAGRRLAPGLTEGFREIERAVEQVAGSGGNSYLTVSAPPSVAAMWLVPRLDRFRARHPDLDIRIDASAALVDFGRDDVDVAIRFGTGQYPGLRSERLFRQNFRPVCSPEYVRAYGLESPADLARANLLHVDWVSQSDMTPNWPMWLAAAGVDGVDVRRGTRFNDSALAVQAAMAGQGVALASDEMVGDQLRAGRLVNPFDLAVEGADDLGIYFVCPDRAWSQPKVRAFRAWIEDEVEDESALPTVAEP